VVENGANLPRLRRALHMHNDAAQFFPTLPSEIPRGRLDNPFYNICASRNSLLLFCFVGIYGIRRYLECFGDMASIESLDAVPLPRTGSGTIRVNSPQFQDGFAFRLTPAWPPDRSLVRPEKKRRRKKNRRILIAISCAGLRMSAFVLLPGLSKSFARITIHHETLLARFAISRPY